MKFGRALPLHNGQNSTKYPKKTKNKIILRNEEQFNWWAPSSASQQQSESPGEQNSSVAVGFIQNHRPERCLGFLASSVTVGLKRPGANYLIIKPIPLFSWKLPTTSRCTPLSLSLSRALTINQSWPLPLMFHLLPSGMRYFIYVELST